MFEAIISCCSSSYRPIIAGGGVVLLVYAVLNIWMFHSISQMNQQLDPSTEDSWFIYIITKLLIYAISWTGFTLLYEVYKKINFRLVVFICLLITAILGLIVVIVYPAHLQRNQQHIIARLNESMSLYNYSQPPGWVEPARNSSVQLTNLTTAAPPLPAPVTGANSSVPDNSTKIDQATATRMWDDIQAAGCCGLKGAQDWKGKIPKSCCNLSSNSTLNQSQPIKDYTCPQADDSHQRGCEDLLEKTTTGAHLMLQLINLVLAVLLVVSIFRVCTSVKYQQASQSDI